MVEDRLERVQRLANAGAWEWTVADDALSCSEQALRLHIGLFGRRNAGKSSLLNALVGQDVAIVSPTPGSTADPVEKTLEMARIELNRVMVERKTHEKLRERAFEEFKQEIAQAESKEIDELVSYNYHEG